MMEGLTSSNYPLYIMIVAHIIGQNSLGFSKQWRNKVSLQDQPGKETLNEEESEALRKQLKQS